MCMFPLASEFVFADAADLILSELYFYQVHMSSKINNCMGQAGFFNQLLVFWHTCMSEIRIKV